MIHRIAETLRLLRDIARELSDQNAYRRYLDARGAAPSATEWRRFSDRRLQVKYARGKCC